MAWSKYEGWPLVLITFLAGGLTLSLAAAAPACQQALALSADGAGRLAFYHPLAAVCRFAGYGGGGRPRRRFLPPRSSPTEFVLLLRALVWIPYFGLLWPAIFLSFVLAGRALFRSPCIFLGLFVAGNLAALALAYGLVPASPAEFPFYVRATVDRLLLHMAPASALILAVPLASAGGLSKIPGEFV